uniref:EGF-like domain-containing protein n=1 Tax=Anopheles culicifacies TaxID=139723 RepID=A0A182M4D2_9DIPT
MDKKEDDKKEGKSYYCDCYAGFSGPDCGDGPLCKDANVCENGGTCKHIGDNAIICICPAGYKGKRCEINEFDEVTVLNHVARLFLPALHLPSATPAGLLTC